MNHDESDCGDLLEETIGWSQKRGWGQSRLCPRLCVPRKKGFFFVFSKISAVYMYDFYNLNTCDECLFLNIKTNIKELWAGRELVAH